MVVLEDSTLTTMSLDSKIVAAFPFLGTLAKAVRKGPGKRGCGSCSRANNERDALLKQIKMTVAGLSSDKKRQLKEMLNTRSARVTYKNASGKIVQLTF
jgi:hypothetical protein